MSSQEAEKNCVSSCSVLIGKQVRPQVDLLVPLCKEDSGKEHSMGSLMQAVPELHERLGLK